MRKDVGRSHGVPPPGENGRNTVSGSDELPDPRVGGALAEITKLSSGAPLLPLLPQEAEVFAGVQDFSRGGGAASSPPLTVTP